MLTRAIEYKTKIAILELDLIKSTNPSLTKQLDRELLIPFQNKETRSWISACFSYIKNKKLEKQTNKKKTKKVIEANNLSFFGTLINLLKSFRKKEEK